MNQANDITLFVGSKPLGQALLRVLREELGAEALHAALLDDSGDSRTALREMRAYCEREAINHTVVRGNQDLVVLVRDLAPRFCMVSGWYQIMSDALLDLVPGRWVGLHPSLLPAYRGGAPLVWALINGEQSTGVSLFYFDEGMDTGDLVGQESFDLGPDEDIAQVLQKAAQTSVSLLRQFARPLARGEAPRLRQATEGVSYGALRKPQDGALDFERGNLEIHNFVRAQAPPYPGAFCALTNPRTSRDAELITITKTRPYAHQCYGTPGLISHLDKGLPVLCCGQGALWVLTAEYRNPGRETREVILKPGQRLWMVKP